MASKTYTLNIDVESKTLGQLEDELAQVNDELKQVDRNSDAFTELAQKSRALTGELERAQGAIEGIKLEDKLQAADGAIKIFGGSLQTVVGTLGALGIESEVFGKFEEKAASAIAVGMGIKDVSEGFGQFITVMKKSGIAAQIFGSTVNKALLATGIGAFVVALGTVVAYWDDITEALGGASKESKEFLANQEAIVEESKAQLDLLNQQDNILKLQGKSEAQILALKISQTDEIISQLKLQKKAAKEVADEQVKQTGKVAAFFQSMKSNPAASGIGWLGDMLGYGYDDVAKIAKNGQEVVDNIDQQITQIENTRAGYILRKQAIEQAEQEKQEERKVKEQEDREKKKTQDEEEIVTTQRKAAVAIDSIQAIGIKQLEVSGITAPAIDANAAAALRAAAAQREYEAAQEYQIQKGIAQNQALGATADALSALGGVLDQESTAAKALAIGSAIINTYLGVTQALATPAVPFIEPFATITRIANVAIVLANGLKAVQQIKKTPPKATGAPGGGGASLMAGSRGAAPSMPNQANLDRMGVPNMCGDAPQNFETGPTVRAYVLTGDINNGQEATAKLNNRRTLG